MGGLGSRGFSQVGQVKTFCLSNFNPLPVTQMSAIFNQLTTQQMLSVQSCAFLFQKFCPVNCVSVKRFYLSPSQISTWSLSLSLTVKDFEHSPVTFFFGPPPAIEVCSHPSLTICHVSKSSTKFHYLLCQTISFW